MRVDPRSETGSAVAVALMAVTLMSAIAAALVLTTSAEQAIAATFRNSSEALYAADAGIERALIDIASAGDWNQLLDGSVRSSFVDGFPSGLRTLSDRTTVDIGQVANLANCGRAASCSTAEMNAVTDERPWGANNPRWRLYAFGRLADLLPAGAINSLFYVVVLVADDPAETDEDPFRDGTTADNPGSDVLSLRAEVFGPRGAHQVVDTTVSRLGDPARHTGARLLSWRLLN